ncbi:MAG: hypothetical protein FVQ80_11435 [Planctomycetes bacterium]|nr:hypothetical protein [Planctomycetota bacterium]
MILANIENSLTIAVICFTGVIGCYALIIAHIWRVAKSLGEIYKVVNGHIQNGKVHVGENDAFVNSAVCEKVQELNEVHFRNIKEGQEKMDGKLDKICNLLTKGGVDG